MSKLFKLLILKTFAIGYVTTIALVMAFGIRLYFDWSFWLVFAVCWLLSLNLVFQDEREIFFRKILQFPFSTYLPRKRH